MIEPCSLLTAAAEFCNNRRKRYRRLRNRGLTAIPTRISYTGAIECNMQSLHDANKTYEPHHPIKNLSFLSLIITRQQVSLQKKKIYNNTMQLIISFVCVRFIESRFIPSVWAEVQ